jgi:CRP-like cAMP-binding protein
VGWSTGSGTREAVVAAVGTSFLGGLPEPILTALQFGAILHHVAAGLVFIEETEPNWVGIIVSGLARVYLDPPDGPELTVRYVRPGSAVGVAALAGTEYPVSVRAITPCRVLQLDLNQVRMVVEREPTAAAAVGRELAARLFDTYQELATLARGSVRQRLAGQLLEVIDEDVETGRQGHPLTVTRTHQELAAAIGSAREVVSKTLAAFAREGMVELGRGTIHLLDPVQLHLVAHSRLSRAVPRPNDPMASSLRGR